MRVITRVLLLVLPVLLGVERAAGAEPVVWRSGAAEIADRIERTLRRRY